MRILRQLSSSQASPISELLPVIDDVLVPPRVGGGDAVHDLGQLGICNSSGQFMGFCEEGFLCIEAF